ncbi:hypothetical protein [Bremerella volcania]
MLQLIGRALGGVGSFFLHLFDTAGFPARWYCGSVWQEEPGVGWLHIVSDLAIFDAYLTIPLILAYFLFRRLDGRFRLHWDQNNSASRRVVGRYDLGRAKR